MLWIRWTRLMKWPGLVLSVLVAAAWLWSGWYSAWWTWGNATVQSGASLRSGLLVIGSRPVAAPVGGPWPGRFAVQYRSTLGWLQRSPQPYWWWGPVQFNAPPLPTEHGFPLWPILPLLAVPSAWAFYWDRRHGRGLCSQCGYNLWGNTTGICPECGTKKSPDCK